MPKIHTFQVRARQLRNAMTAGGFVSRILLTAALLAIVALDPSSSQASPVYILNKHAQLVTSSSLLWVSK